MACTYSADPVTLPYEGFKDGKILSWHALDPCPQVWLQLLRQIRANDSKKMSWQKDKGLEVCQSAWLSFLLCHSVSVDVLSLTYYHLIRGEDFGQF